MKARVGIVGGAGYVGGEMIRLILNHPDCQLKYVSSRSQNGRAIYEVHPDLRGWSDMKFSNDYDTGVDVLFICMGHGKSREFLAKVDVGASTLVIDLSRDFRLKPEAQSFVYGLSELNKAQLNTAKKIANPGCFATCIQLGLIPMASQQALNTEIHVTAITGSTGAGQNPVPTTHNSWRNNNISVYKAFMHQHLDEIIQSLTQLQNSFDSQFNFIPMRGSFTRGIFASMYFDSDLSEQDVIGIYDSFYSKSPFVHLSHKPVSVKDVVNTNNCLLHISKFKNKIRIESVIDNLLKGASGQAVQNMNIAMGWPEDSGLRLKASVF